MMFSLLDLWEQTKEKVSLVDGSLVNAIAKSRTSGFGSVCVPKALSSFHCTVSCEVIC